MMKTNPKEELLHDILRDASAGFRQELFEASLKELRKRRASSNLWPRLPLAIAAGFVLSIGLFLFGMVHRTNRESVLQDPEVFRPPLFRPMRTWKS